MLKRKMPVPSIALVGKVGKVAVLLFYCLIRCNCKRSPREVKRESDREGGREGGEHLSSWRAPTTESPSSVFTDGILNPSDEI